jgi:hypothetical protein
MKAPIGGTKSQTIDVEALPDGTRWSTYQKLMTALVAPGLGGGWIQLFRIDAQLADGLRSFLRVELAFARETR